MQGSGLLVTSILAGVAITLSFIGSGVVDSLPIGAPNCAIDQPAPGGLHLLVRPSRIRETGPISNHGLNLILDGRTIEDGGGSPGSFTINQDHTIQIQSRRSAVFPPLEPYRGVLLLLHQSSSGLDMSKALVPLGMYQSAPGCLGTLVAGVTHQEDAFKNQTLPIALLRYNVVATGIKLDVNVVVANNSTHSLYYYTQFTLDAVASPTAAPTKSPTKRPTLAPTRRPTMPPTKAPVTTVPLSSSPSSCGLFRRGIFCPLSGCGWIGRLLGLCRRSPQSR
jgi:hypothetical protein